MARRSESGGTVLIRLSANHFAFLRGYLEGLELSSLARRYLETAVTPDTELAAARGTLRWIREQLLMTARRRGQLQDVRLLLIDPDKLHVPPTSVAPTLEEFREERDPHELLSEAELMALFREEHGDGNVRDRRALRNERLRRRQLQILQKLESLLGTPPAVQDEVGGWFHAKLAARLQAAGFATLGTLAKEIQTRGYRWWTRVPRVGRIAAAQITAWFRTETVEQALGIKMGPHTYVKPSLVPASLLHAVRAPQTAIVPLEFLRLPALLDGSGGKNRGSHSAIPASNDIAAIQAWLSCKPEGGSTWRSYRKEAERFLLWATLALGCPLSSLTREDCAAYRDFLERVGVTRDTEDWCAPRGTKRWNPAWRPFEGALSAQSRHQAFTILSGMCSWLARQGYLAVNPWPAPAPRPAIHSQERGFSDNHWNVLQQAVERRAALVRDGKAERLRVLLALCRECGMKLSELARATVADLQPPASTDAKWILSMADGRHIELSLALVELLDDYLHARGLGNLTSCPRSTYLLGRLPAARNPRPPRRLDGPELSVSALYQLLKNFFSEIAFTLEKERPDMAARFRRASTEWLRHRSHQFPPDFR